MAADEDRHRGSPVELAVRPCGQATQVCDSRLRANVSGFRRKAGASGPPPRLRCRFAAGKRADEDVRRRFSLVPHARGGRPFPDRKLPARIARSRSGEVRARAWSMARCASGTPFHSRIWRGRLSPRPIGQPFIPGADGPQSALMRSHAGTWRAAMSTCLLAGPLLELTGHAGDKSGVILGQARDRSGERRMPCRTSIAGRCPRGFPDPNRWTAGAGLGASERESR